MFLTDGATAGQEVLHGHLHVVPRLAEDGFGFKLPERYYRDVPKRQRLDEDTATLRAALPEA